MFVIIRLQTSQDEGGLLAINNDDSFKFRGEVNPLSEG